MIEKDKKISYPKVIKLLNSLSFNETLKYAEINYYSFKEQRKIVDHIKFSIDKLTEILANIKYFCLKYLLLLLLKLLFFLDLERTFK